MEEKQNFSDEQTIIIGAQMGAQIALNTKSVFTFSEACSYLGLSHSQLYKLTASRVLPYSKPNGKVIFFKREDLEAWAMGAPVASTQQISDEALEVCNKKGGRK